MPGVRVHTHYDVCGGQRSELRSQFSLVTFKVPGMKSDQLIDWVWTNHLSTCWDITQDFRLFSLQEHTLLFCTPSWGLEFCGLPNIKYSETFSWNLKNNVFKAVAFFFSSESLGIIFFFLNYDIFSLQYIDFSLLYWSLSKGTAIKTPFADCYCGAAKQETGAMYGGISDRHDGTEEMSSVE